MAEQQALIVQDACGGEVVATERLTQLEEFGRLQYIAAQAGMFAPSVSALFAPVNSALRSLGKATGLRGQ